MGWTVGGHGQHEYVDNLSPEVFCTELCNQVLEIISGQYGLYLFDKFLAGIIFPRQYPGGKKLVWKLNFPHGSVD